MARLSSLSVALTLVFVILGPVLEARELPSVVKNGASSLEASLVLSSLPRAIVPPSSPSNGGDAKATSEKLFARRGFRVEGRNLGSVPSPGVGH
ncbi:UNVERIFIED_CONTAM: hypothetical protein Sradi_6076500 [Sesamum radiatum]|uniref:Uncharacterized protein n=1 Tax=Sesamum radiatum TaxID=300843 RepID=A0AAW2KK02_SESRA